MRFCLALLLSLCATLAHADLWADYYAALEQFNGMLEDAAKNDTLPDIKDEKVAAVIAVLTDSRRYLMPPAEPFDNISELTEFCDQAKRIYQRYIFAGVKIGPAPNEDQSAMELRVAKQVAQNTVKYQDILARVHPFMLRCSVGIVPLTSKVVLSLKPEEVTAVRLQGLQQARLGLTQIYFGALAMLSTEGMKESVRATLARVLAEIAPTCASMLSPSFRQQILTQVQNQQTVFNSRLKADFDAITQAMGDAKCDGMCKF